MGSQARIGIIGAGGWLGKAFSQSIVEAGIADAEALTLSYRSAKPDVLPSATWTKDNQLLVERSDVVIVSVRPEDFPAVRVSAQGKLVISVMAGVTLEHLARHLQTDRIVRSLPNGAAEVRSSYTPWVASEAAGEEDCRIAQAIFESCGTSDRLATEADIDYFTGLTGSGPAFPALLAAAMMNHAVARGINRDVARRGVNALLVGAGRLAELRADCPNDLVETFMAYRGTTAAAMDAMRAAGIDDAVGRGLDAAFRKSIAMGHADAEAPQPTASA
ncbi:pyrroline-5-carboxylate reductase [Sinorhizobium fredii NGR234]|uniref:Pyrroline-5-carboxylate reductase n=1 Tax=Sinorhizobium fredii (strain NBRC 101917 / NGR234) TaxID=394 RepID=C3MED3_SINFN|nr:pyrroline-5-carboxylate reductase dimerization domain-containing protein [Sinorhizobium fredii]ACP25802.1 pyrroline-5-carboxylate reductase [Sinorhizobium fredii NGR234]